MKDSQNLPEGQLPFSEENLLKVILRHKQTYGMLLSKFGYHEEMRPILEKLVNAGKIKKVWCYERGWRFVFVRPDYDESSLKNKRSKFLTQKVEKYLKKKGEKTKKKEESN